MSKKYWLCLIAFALVGVMVASPVFAEVTFKWGPYLRVRHEFWRNWNDMTNGNVSATPTSDNRNFFRIKTSLWGQANVTKSFSLYGKLTNESRSYTYYHQSSGDKKKGFHYDINEIVFDNLYFDVKNFGEMPVDVRVGRQDLIGQYGEGFLISDGTPQDGSRTTFFDAIKASWKINKKNTLDFIYLSDDATDEKLPVINRLDGKGLPAGTTGAEQQLNLGDEQGFIAYLKSDPTKKLHLENYYVYKAEEGGIGTKLGARKSTLSTVGTYAKYTLAPWTFKAQLASQFGKYGDDARRAMGGYGFVTRDFKKAMFSPVVNAGYMYLSGDDRDSSTNESWNPVFSRWPIMSDVYSELYYLTYNNEAGALGYWTNLQLYKIGLGLSPTKKTKLSLAYYYLRANETITPTSDTFGTGKNRGTLTQAKFDYTFNKNLSAYVMGEYLHAGDFYVASADDACFLRTQLELKF